MFGGEPSLLVPCLYLCQASTGWTVSAVSQKTAKNARMTHVVFWQSFSGFLPSPVCMCVFNFIYLLVCLHILCLFHPRDGVPPCLFFIHDVHADVYISCTPYDRTLYILATVSTCNLLNFTKYKTRSASESLPYRHIYIGAGLHLLIKHSSRSTCT